MIWDSLPDCLIETIYKKILIPQPKKLLDDIKSYNYTIYYINYYLELNKFITSNDEWFIVLLCINILYNEEEESERNKFIELQKFIEYNNNLSIIFHGRVYWINKLVAKMSISNRNSLINYLNIDDIK